MQHWDLISIIKDTWTRMESTPVKAYVKGHQEGHNRPLTRLEQMNVLMDGLAKQTALLRPPRKTIPNLSNLGIPQVYIQDKMVVEPLQKSLYYDITKERLWQYIDRKLNIQHTQVVWTAFKRARLASDMVTNTFISKWLSNTLPTGKVLQLRQHSISNRCPRCNTWGEDRLHILTCWEVGAKTIWDKGVHKLTLKMIEANTCPDIQQFILNSLANFRKSPGNQHRYAPHQTWARAQHDMGWENFLCGILHCSIIQKQQEYYRSIGSRKGGDRWATNMILQLWSITRNMWLGRCSALHKKSFIYTTLSLHLLDIEIETEYDAGCEDLPDGIRKWFRPTKQFILNQSPQYKKGWLFLIKSVKESLQIAEYSIFTSSKTLRRWIGFKE
jgi:hypothetical protein